MYVIGVDLGGTSTRVALAGPDGEIVGTGTAGGGNPTTHGAAAAAGELAAALREALVGHDPSGVLAGVIGMAGVGAASKNPAALEAFARAWREAGLTCPYRLVPDPLVGYASAAREPDGTVVVAGTGAIAAQVTGYAIDRLAGGHGWLLGDDGSGYWLGRAAVRVALDDLDIRRPLAPLSVLVLTELLGSAEVAPNPRDTAWALVGAVNAAQPIALARLAPLVSQAHAAADPTAIELVDAAAQALVDTTAMIRPPDSAAPIVLAGALLTAEDSALAGPLRDRLAARWPDSPLAVARNGAAGAARLAALDARGIEVRPRSATA
jgi:glucosamine kinase